MIKELTHNLFFLCFLSLTCIVMYYFLYQPEVAEFHLSNSLNFLIVFLENIFGKAMNFLHLLLEVGIEIANTPMK